MPDNIKRYLDDVRRNLRLDREAESEVIHELQTHIEDRLSEMEEAGLSEEDATSVCLRILGSARQVARQIYEAHSQGSWQQAAMGSLPHLLFALIFILNWWQGLGCLIISLALVSSTVLYGWLHGRPIWLFPWLGYMLLPVIGAGLLLIYLPRGWSWIAILVYLPLALWLIGAVTVKTIKKDWQQRPDGAAFADSCSLVHRSRRRRLVPRLQSGANRPARQPHSLELPHHGARSSGLYPLTSALSESLYSRYLRVFFITGRCLVQRRTGIARIYPS